MGVSGVPNDNVKSEGPWSIEHDLRKKPPLFWKIYVYWEVSWWKGDVKVHRTVWTGHPVDLVTSGNNTVLLNVVYVRWS